MRLVIDTNVFLDVILDRPSCDAAARVLALSEQKDCELLMPAHAAATIAYIVEKNRDRSTAAQALSLCLGIARVAPLDESAILRGLSLGFRDVEDSFVAAIAIREQADFIVTGNVKNFVGFLAPAITAAELIARFDA
ncbi:PIN domain-containing protein [Bifidobacterium oedipodis]|uniref:Toxin PIN n=1 Tax=Bifidobacterium oedipodis TaxID=2675322 RepID=A0A7Y0HTE4_9BIFI|nr:PIN domain-containing protein [Bifidobacterium sp. DSM 109957]NMM94022.1 toxin PIN [Bifidobacterium sp. DSM 109957]